MHTVIKNTKSIDEYKQVKILMEMLTEKCYAMHKQSFENWENGEPVKTWFDSNNNLCIEYENGKWWHYNENGEWW